MNHLIDWHLEPDDIWEASIASALEFARAGRPDVRAVDGQAMRLSGAGKSIALLFFNPSLRTRTSMEVAAARLGAHSSIIVPGQGTWGFVWEDGVRMDGGEAEHIQEAVGVLSQYFDAIGVRLFASLTNREADRQDLQLNRFVAAAQVPVINLESAYYHPCQALADASTITEHFAAGPNGGTPAGKKFVLTWAYHPKALPTAVPNSALLAAARMGMDVTVARPDGFELDPSVMEMARRHTTVRETNNMDEAVDGAHVVYAKAWSGAGVYTDPEAEAVLRARHTDWCVTDKRMQRTDQGVFMHCLPVRRGVVVEDAVLDGPQAIHLRQAAFRLYAQQAILSRLWDLPYGPSVSGLASP
ncbi:MAG: N-acetylornithine carbamoyltransferase [Rhodothermales bacterium]|jgi:N-acetylornithine carbamoyltransferase